MTFVLNLLALFLKGMSVTVGVIVGVIVGLLLIHLLLTLLGKLVKLFKKK